MVSRLTPTRLSRRAAAGIRRIAAGTRERVRIDTRSLAAFRIALGLLIVADVLLRSRNLERFYTDDGVVPAELAIAAEPVAAYSPYALVTSPRGVSVLFVITALVGVALAIGYYTRLMTVTALVLVVSLDARNPFVLSFADVLFATLLAFAVLLPLGERWSVDAVVSDRPRRESVASVATALVLTQVVVMYVVNGYHKTTSELWRSGEAAVLILGIDEITFLLGDALRAVPELLRVGGFVWLVMLCLAWLLVLLRGRSRHLFVAAFMIAHLSMALTVRIGAFSYVCLAGLVLFLQGSAWSDLDHVGRRVPIRFGIPRSRLVSARARLVAIARRVPRPTTTFPARLLTAIRRRLPESIASHAVVVVAVAGVVTVLLIAGGLSAAGVLDDDTPQAEVDAGMAALVDFQTDWSIFAPVPRTTDRYYVFPARATDGSVVDAYTDRSLSYDRPYETLQNQHSTYRERFYMVSVFEDERVARQLAEHVCETYRTESGSSLERIEMYRVTEEITRETIAAPETRERSFSRTLAQDCAGGNNGDALPSPPSA